MKSPAIIEVEGVKYMSTNSAAILWDVKPRTVSDYCKNNRITHKFKDGNRGWYIRIDEMKPLSISEVRQILILTLQLKNNPSLDIDWSVFNFDISIVEKIYKNLVLQGYIMDFSIEDNQRIPYEVILTDKGLELVTAYRKEKLDINYEVALREWIPIILRLGKFFIDVIELSNTGV